MGYSNIHVSDASLAFMAFSGVMGLVIPIVLFIWFRHRGADVLPFFVGCAVMCLFVFVIESGIHQLVLSSEQAQGVITDVFLYAVYGGAMAGIFEETGRFLAFKTVLRGRLGNNRNALMYGAGHGGLEAVMVLTVGMSANLLLSYEINAGHVAGLEAGLSGNLLHEVETVIESLVNTPPSDYLIGPVERAIAVVFHIALSVIVWFAAKDRRLVLLYPVAIVLHAEVDALAFLSQSFGFKPLGIEIALASYTAIVVLFAWRVWTLIEHPEKRDLQYKAT